MNELFNKHYVTKIESTYSCESICAFKDKVLIGTKQGLIIIYSINYEKPDGKSGDIKSSFNFAIRDFNRKPITQIELAEEFGIFLSLSAGIIYVHRTNDYRLTTTCDIKSISIFCIDVYDPAELDNISAKKITSESLTKQDTGLMLSILKDNISRTSLELRICIVSKKKLIILNWDKLSQSFKNTDKSFKSQDYPLAVKFLFNYLCVATRYEYSLYNIDNGEIKPIFNVGKCQEPFMMRVSDLLGLKIDETVVFINKDGNMVNDSNIRWSFLPSNFIYHPPFAISVLEKYIEFRLISPPRFIQSLSIEGASLICRYLDRIYVLSDRKLYIIISQPRLQQVKQQYVDNQDFELALILAKTATLVGENFIDTTMINIMYALKIFCNQQFEKSFNIFAEMSADPTQVLNLFPNICPEKFKDEKNFAKYIIEASKFQEEERKEATRALIDYLVKWRVKLRKAKSTLICSSLTDGKSKQLNKSILQQMVDTTLIKCYVDIGSPLVAPLLRQDNFCHLDETKITLEKHDKFQELVLLYEHHDHHDDALELLHEHCSKTNSPLFGIQPTLNYMKNLNYENLMLIYKFGDDILQNNPMEWLTIFTHWFQKEKSSQKESKQLGHSAYKNEVLKHLQEKRPDMVIPFLERIIYDNINLDDFDLEYVDYHSQEAQEHVGGLYKSKFKNSLKDRLLPLNEEEDLPIIEKPLFANVSLLHTSYIASLITQILSLRSSSLLPIKIQEKSAIDLEDNKIIYDLRLRLKRFLQSEKAIYNADHVLSKFPYDAFYEERTLVLARIGKHEQALTLWIYLLDDWDQAEQYCNTVYETNNEIFYKLLNVCIEPSDPTSIGIVLPNFGLEKKHSISENKFVPKLGKALDIMKVHGDKLYPALAIKLLSSAFEINDLLSFAQNSLRRQASQLNQCVFLRNLLFYNRLWSNFKACVSAQKSFIVTDKSVCAVCKKLMGSSAFARRPDESLVHYGCFKNI